MAGKKYDAPAADAVLDVLEFMAENTENWGPTELARKLELSPNMTFRILNVLTNRGYVTRNENGNYRLTAALFALGMKQQNSFDLRSCARPFLEQLAEETCESVQLQVPDGNMMMLFDFVPPPTPFYLAITPGVRLHWLGNAFGKAVLAFLPQGKQQERLLQPTPQLTGKTITDKAELRRELDQIRQIGSACEFEEYLPGHYCVASPVFNAAGEVIAAVGISGLISRYNPENLPVLQQKILKYANKISQSIGHNKGE